MQCILAFAFASPLNWTILWFLELLESRDFLMELVVGNKKGVSAYGGAAPPWFRNQGGGEDQTLWGLTLGPCVERHLMGAGSLLVDLGDNQGYPSVQQKSGTQRKVRPLLHFGVKVSRI